MTRRNDHHEQAIITIIGLIGFAVFALTLTAYLTTR